MHPGKAGPGAELCGREEPEVKSSPLSSSFGDAVDKARWSTSFDKVGGCQPPLGMHALPGTSTVRGSLTGSRCLHECKGGQMRFFCQASHLCVRTVSVIVGSCVVV